MKPDVERLAGRRIDETLLGVDPVGSWRHVEWPALMTAVAQQQPRQQRQTDRRAPDQKAGHGAGSIIVAIASAAISLMMLSVSTLPVAFSVVTTIICASVQLVFISVAAQSLPERL